MKFRVLLLVLMLSLLAQANSFKIDDNKFVILDANKKIKKEISLGAKIENVEKIGKFVVLITKQAIYISDKNAKLYTKKLFTADTHYVYRVENMLILRQENNYFALKLLQDGTLRRENFYIPIDEKMIFVSKTKSKKIVVFTEKNIYIDTKAKEFFPIYLDKDELFYFDKDFTNLYRATLNDYKEKVSHFAKQKLYIPKTKLTKLSPEKLLRMLNVIKTKEIRMMIVSVYLKKVSLDKKTLALVFQKLPPKSAYEVLLKSNLINPNTLGGYKFADYKKLLKDIASLHAKDETYKYIYNKVPLRYKTTQKNHTTITLKGYFASNILFKLQDIPATCRLIGTKETTEEGYNSFLFIPVSYYKNLYKIKKYTCHFSQKKLLKKIKKDLQKRGIKHIDDTSLQQKWQYKEKIFVKNLSFKKTAFGEALTSESKKSTKNCKVLKQECDKLCKTKENRFRFFVLSSSDRHKCENLCIEANYFCKKGNQKNMKASFCDAQCIGLDTQTGFISSSKYDKCYDKCLNEF